MSIGTAVKIRTDISQQNKEVLEREYSGWVVAAAKDRKLILDSLENETGLKRQQISNWLNRHKDKEKRKEEGSGKNQFLGSYLGDISPPSAITSATSAASAASTASAASAASTASTTSTTSAASTAPVTSQFSSDDARKLGRLFNLKHRQMVSQNLHLAERSQVEPFSYNADRSSRGFMRTLKNNVNVFSQRQSLEWWEELEKECEKLEQISGTDAGVKHFMVIWTSDGTKLDIGWDARDKVGQLLRYIRQVQSEISVGVEEAVTAQREEFELCEAAWQEALFAIDAKELQAARDALNIAKKTLSDARVVARSSENISPLVAREFVCLFVLLLLLLLLFF